MRIVKLFLLAAISTIIIFNGVKYPALIYAQDYGMEIWNIDLKDGPIQSLGVVADLSEDGFPDLLAGTDSGLYCIEMPDGVLWWSAPTTGTVWAVADIGDVNADGVADIAVGTAANEVRCYSGAASAGMGVEIWRRSGLGGDVRVVLAFPDMDNDTFTEVIVGTDADEIHLLNGDDGSIVWTYPVGGGGVRVATIVPDVNGDGVSDIAVGAGDGVVYCLDGAAGKLLWQYGGLAIVWSLAVLPDGDGTPDILVGTGDNRVLLLRGDTSVGTLDRKIWDFQANGDVGALEVLPDMNGDGRIDAAAGGADDRLYIIDAQTGDPLWTRNLNGEIFSIVQIRDFTRDGKPEIAVGTAYSAVFCQSGENGYDLWSYPFVNVGAIRHVVTIPDMGADGVEEIVAASTNGMIRMLSGSAGLGMAHVLGDADCDLDVDLMDVAVVLKFLAGIGAGTMLPPAGCVPGDGDGNGRAELADAVLALRMAAGIQ